MQIKDLIPWKRKGSEIARRPDAENPLLGLQREMNRVFDGFWRRFDQPFGGLDSLFGQATPRTDIVETDKAVEVSVELPGIDEKDIEITLVDDTLTIQGEKKAEREESRKGFHLSERAFGSFYRAIPLPPGIKTDAAEAKFRKGVLTVTLPKSPEAAAKTRKIEVKGA